MDAEIRVGILARTLSSGIVEKGFTRRRYACFVPGFLQTILYEIYKNMFQIISLHNFQTFNNIPVRLKFFDFDLWAENR